MQGLPHWIGIPGYVSLCCLCYHTAAYCRTRWSANPGLQEDPVKSRELERSLRLLVRYPLWMTWQASGQNFTVTVSLITDAAQ